MLNRALTVAAVLALGVALTASAGTYPMSLDQAFDKAAQTEQPVLMKIGTEWCSACQAFDKAVATDDAFRAGVGEDAILVQIDAEKGDGVQVAQRYNVSNFPTFILANAEGEVMDRWVGFKKSGYFTKTLDKAVVDAMPVSERWTRYRQEPNAKDAAKLANLRMSEGYYADAAALYGRAMDLDKVEDYTWNQFMAVSKGTKNGLFTTTDLTAAADAVYARADENSSSMFGVLWTMRDAARHEGDNDLFVPYLKAAVEATEGSEDKEVVSYRRRYEADYVLFVEEDVDKAIEVKKATMDEGWEQNTNQLNNFAWWCFENSINLDEAYAMAQKGVDLAKAGNEKANVLDTLAEICNVKGDCDEAVTLIHLAIAEDPNNEYFQKQAERFEEAALAQQN